MVVSGIAELNVFFESYSTRKSSLVSHYRSSIDMFFHKFGYSRKLYQNFQKEINKKLSGRFNTFDYIKVDELALSNIIALMLDSEGSHGQGSLF